MTKTLDPPSEPGDLRAEINGGLVSAVETVDWLIFMDPPEPVVAPVTT